MLQNLRHYYLHQMGIDVWTTRKARVHQKNLDELALKVSACVRCPLHQTRTQTVFSRGNPNASLMIIGEAPGAHEDKQGLPFVGDAGGLLNKMLQSIGMACEDVYITNVIKCRPPENRPPNQEEITACANHLSEQIAILTPKVILAVGHCAGQFLLGSTAPLNQMRKKVHDFNGISVIVSYHPAYLLRHPADKKYAYEDLLLVQQRLKGRGI